MRSLQILWLWAAVNRPDGILSGMDWEDIELAADWMGEERAFFDHILGMWLDETPGGYVLHDWQEHNSWAAEAEVRGKQSRLAKLAQVNREAYDECVRRGITELTAEEYKRLKCAPTATALRPNSDLTAAQQRPQSAPTADASASLGPAPAPSPSPEEINTRGGVITRARARMPHQGRMPPAKAIRSGPLFFPAGRYTPCSRVRKRLGGNGCACMPTEPWPKSTPFGMRFCSWRLKTVAGSGARCRAWPNGFPAKAGTTSPTWNRWSKAGPRPMP